MASLKDIRKRIASVKNTQQITKAMKMVAAAKLRRAQDAVTSARPYANELKKLLSDILDRIEIESDADAPPAHPLLASRKEIRRCELVILTSDRGLCGGFNSNIIRAANRFLLDHSEIGELETYEEIYVSTIGRRGRDFFARRRDVKKGIHHEGVFDDLRYARAEEIASDLARRFVEHELDAVFLLYNTFRSAISQEVTLERLLPIPDPRGNGRRPTPDAPRPFVDFEYGPARPEVLEKLVPQTLSTRVWQALLESNASEHGARMSAMDNATRNAGEMIESLTLLANRTRQAAITTELVEIVSGAEAL